ncbi:hypothetical protein F2P81_005436 [Scophthalmus maximus]|uniref:Uncharacterized protein n=1 Tax=Scophthalmus maximus TaxID=52904 RepID=A0A6A4TFA9_SCOMX|nr:hypothetical protein F2P81_005436 [Scophthalmus maximus]
MIIGNHNTSMAQKRVVEVEEVKVVEVVEVEEEVKVVKVVEVEEVKVVEVVEVDVEEEVEVANKPQRASVRTGSSALAVHESDRDE